MGSWEDLVSVATRRINTLKKDCVIAVTGNPGRGKTCLAMHLAYAVDKQFTPSTSVLFYPTLDKAKKMFEDLGQQRAIIFDEANAVRKA